MVQMMPTKECRRGGTLLVVDCLRSGDVRARLNEQLTDVEQNFVVPLGRGTAVGVKAYITGDGKGMLNGHHMEGERCWLCDGSD